MTKKPISTISFNTSAFLRGVLDSLVDDSLISHYMYILHYAEEDTKKDHYHVILFPSRPLDSLAVRRRFVEPCPDGLPDRGCLPFVSSKDIDWLLYALHYMPYLVRRGLVRLNHYRLEHIQTNETSEYLDDLFSRARESADNNRINCFLRLMQEGQSFGDILSLGLVPPNQVVFYEKLYNLNWRVVPNADKVDSKLPF